MFLSTHRGKRGLIAATALIAGLALPASASAGGGPTNFTVNDNASGSGPAGADCANATYTSIQDAIDAATPGTQIFVCAGQYPESVQVSKAVQLRGAKAGVDGRNRSGASQESVILGDGSTNGGVNLTESGIVLDGFVVTNSADPAIGAGIAMSPSEGNQTIVNNIVTDNTIGISANNADGSPSTISRNKFSDNNRAGAAAGNAIYADSNADDLTITQNSFENQTNSAILFAGVGPAASNSNISITNNSIEGSNGTPARNELNVQLIYTEDSTVSGNSFSNVNNNAVVLSGGNDGITVQDNDIDGSGFAGVRVRDPFGAGPNSNISVLGNTLTGGSSGIYVSSGGLVTGGTVTATGNRIVGNNNEVDGIVGGIVNTSAGAVAADDNWWGCNTGPNTAGCDTTSGAGIDASEFLTLAISAPAKIKKGKSKAITATIEGGTPCLFPDDTSIGFSTTRGTLGASTALTQSCSALSSLRATKSKGTATVSATLDNATVSDTVKFKKAKKKKKKN